MIRRTLAPALGFVTFLAGTLPLRAAEALPPAPSWHAQSLGQALLNMVLFAISGVILAIVSYKLFDRCTPGDLSSEILKNRNVAAAIVAGSVILGVCIITAAAMFS